MLLNTQPVGAEGSVLGAIPLGVVIETTGKKLEVPCYVIDSTKPIWQGEIKNCGMIMGTNALVAFQFCISHSNGIVISPLSLMKQEESADLLKSHELSKQTRNMIGNEQCDFADGICNCQELSKVPPRITPANGISQNSRVFLFTMWS